MTVPFLQSLTILRAGPRRFNIAVERLLLHLGFDDIRLIDGAGDGGGDILAFRGPESFVFQCKWTTATSVSRNAVDEVEAAMRKYETKRAIVVSNAKLDQGAEKRVEALRRIGITIESWSGSHLLRLGAAIPEYAPAGPELRPYQLAAVSKLEQSLSAKRRALAILATGLGKTVVGGEVIKRHLVGEPESSVLVVGATKELVRQLERALWRHLPKSIRTQVVTGDDKPDGVAGVICATIESACSLVVQGYRPNLIMVDESHHLGEQGMLMTMLSECSASLQFGVTATPWRGDGFDISLHFGPPCYTMGIAEGMAAGWLAQVDYRVMVDNVDWEVVQDASKHAYSVRDLNSRLFLPQRDEAVLDILWSTWTTLANPRAILFCKTIPHAEAMATALARYVPNWRNTACLHNDLSRRERDVALSAFRGGRIPILTAVDVLNEGVDVPDVNIVGFLRVTHSRRIFVQQLGRGLRLKPGIKEQVVVLDFVTDIRRLAAITSLRGDLTDALNKGPVERLALETTARIEFSDARVGTLMEAWLKDAANLETALDEARLQFPTGSP